MKKKLAMLLAIVMVAGVFGPMTRPENLMAGTLGITGGTINARLAPNPAGLRQAGAGTTILDESLGFGIAPGRLAPIGTETVPIGNQGNGTHLVIVFQTEVTSASLGRDFIVQLHDAEFDYHMSRSINGEAQPNYNRNILREFGEVSTINIADGSAPRSGRRLTLASFPPPGTSNARPIWTDVTTNHPPAANQTHLHGDVGSQGGGVGEPTGGDAVVITSALDWLDTTAARLAGVYSSAFAAFDFATGTDRPHTSFARSTLLGRVNNHASGLSGPGADPTPAQLQRWGLAPAAMGLTNDQVELKRQREVNALGGAAFEIALQALNELGLYGFRHTTNSTDLLTDIGGFTTAQRVTRGTSGAHHLGTGILRNVVLQTAAYSPPDYSILEWAPGTANATSTGTLTDADIWAHMRDIWQNGVWGSSVPVNTVLYFPGAWVSSWQAFDTILTGAAPTSSASQAQVADYFFALDMQTRVSTPTAAGTLTGANGSTTSMFNHGVNDNGFPTAAAGYVGFIVIDNPDAPGNKIMQPIGANNAAVVPTGNWGLGAAATKQQVSNMMQDQLSRLMNFVEGAMWAEAMRRHAELNDRSISNWNTPMVSYVDEVAFNAALRAQMNAIAARNTNTNVADGGTLASLVRGYTILQNNYISGTILANPQPTDMFVRLGTGLGGGAGSLLGSNRIKASDGVTPAHYYTNTAFSSYIFGTPVRPSGGGDPGGNRLIPYQIKIENHDHSFMRVELLRETVPGRANQPYPSHIYARGDYIVIPLVIRTTSATDAPTINVMGRTMSLAGAGVASNFGTTTAAFTELAHRTRGNIFLRPLEIRENSHNLLQTGWFALIPPEGYNIRGASARSSSETDAPASHSGNNTVGVKGGIEMRATGGLAGSVISHAVHFNVRERSTLHAYTHPRLALGLYLDVGAVTTGRFVTGSIFIHELVLEPIGDDVNLRLGLDRPLNIQVRNLHNSGLGDFGGQSVNGLTANHLPSGAGAANSTSLLSGFEILTWDGRVAFTQAGAPSMNLITDAAGDPIANDSHRGGTLMTSEAMATRPNRVWMYPTSCS
jgi:hypothetical protein